MPVFDPSRDSWERYASMPFFFDWDKLGLGSAAKAKLCDLSVYAIGRHSAYPRFFSWGRRSKMLAMSLATCNGY